MADRLALRGLVQVDGFVSADTGDLIVLDVKEPKLAEGHPLLAQVRWAMAAEAAHMDGAAWRARQQRAQGWEAGAMLASSRGL